MNYEAQELVYSLPNSSFTATSYLNTVCQPWDSRISNVNPDVWCPATRDDPNDYLQIGYVTIYGRRNVNNVPQWVQTYYLLYSMTGNESNFTHAYNQDNNIIFTGNSNSNDGVTSYFNQSIVTAKYIRIQPITYATYTTLRIGVYGYCPGTHDTPSPTSSPITYDSIDFTLYEGMQCLGTDTDLERQFVGTVNDCKARCIQLDCDGFIRVNSGSFAGECFFKSGLQAPYNYTLDDRHCYVPINVITDYKSKGGFGYTTGIYSNDGNTRFTSDLSNSGQWTLSTRTNSSTPWIKLWTTTYNTEVTDPLIPRINITHRLDQISEISI